MSQFNIFFGGEIDISKVVAKAATFDIHLLTTTKNIDGNKIDIAFDYSTEPMGIGIAQDNTESKTFSEYIKKLEAKPFQIEAIKQKPGYRDKIKSLLARKRPLEKDMSTMIEKFGSSPERFFEMQESERYKEICKKVKELRDENTLLHESYYFSQEGHEYLLAELYKCAEKFTNLESFFASILEDCDSIKVITYMETGDVSKTPLVTAAKIKTSLSDLSIEDIVFLKYNVLLEITR